MSHRIENTKVDYTKDEEYHTKTNKEIISACGCDTDHHDGIYISTVYKAKRVYFCAQNCKEEFLEDPEEFLSSDHFALEFELLDDA